MVVKYKFHLYFLYILAILFYFFYLSHQNPENRSGLDQKASEHCSKNVLPAEARIVNHLLEEGEDEHADSPSERKEQHPPRRNLMLRQNHRYGNQCAGESSYSEVRPLVKSPIGEKTLEKIQYLVHILCGCYVKSDKCREVVRECRAGVSCAEIKHAALRVILAAENLHRWNVGDRIVCRAGSLHVDCLKE